MKAVLLFRKEQEDENSVDVQTTELKDYCDRHALEAVKTYEVAENLTVGDRKQFREMLDLVKASHKETGECVAIVADKAGYLIRNPSDQTILDQLVKEGIAELHFASESRIIRQDSMPEDRMIWGIPGDFYDR